MPAFCAGGLVLIAGVMAFQPIPVTYRGFERTAGPDGRQVRQFTGSGSVLFPVNGWRPLLLTFEARTHGADHAAETLDVSADGALVAQLPLAADWRRHELVINTRPVFPRHVEIGFSVASPGRKIATDRVVMRHQLLAWHTAQLFLLGGALGFGVWLAARRVAWRPPLRTAAFGAALSVYLLIVTRVAWVGDDAYITFRTIENVLQGHGLRWNVAERVQTFTHPLWFAVLVPARTLAGEPYVAALALSFAVALAAFCVMLRVSSSTAAAVLGSILLVLSRSFGDYSTSGLENPLLFLMLGLFFVRQWSAPTNGADTILWLLASLIFLTRPDAILLILPALALSSWRARTRIFHARTLAALAPAVAWVLFSFWYYGFPVPNTAPAKLNAGVPAGELLASGVRYFRASVEWDPIIVVIAVLAAAGALAQRSKASFAALAGVLAYCTYLLRIGGDFMVGRFVAAPVFVGVLVIVRTYTMRSMPAWLNGGIIAAATAIWCAVHPAVLERLRSGSVTIGYLREGIVDERWNYYAALGLLSRRASDDPALVAGMDAREKGQKIALRSAIGLFGFAAGPCVHVLDTLALSDPLLARLPANPPWRPGHLERRIPEGYVETLETGVNRLRDARLARFYDDLSFVTRGPLWSIPRLRTAAALNTERSRVTVPKEIVALETPAHDTTVSTPFEISGWAVDLSAASGTGVDAVHVYAYSRSTTSAEPLGDPLLLGMGSYGQPRPDVARHYGTQFTNAGYRLRVDAGRLQPGGYFLVVYARSAATQLFNARRIRVTIH